MAKPVLHTIAPFDGSSGSVISFSYVGTITKVEALFYTSDADGSINASDEGRFYVTQKAEYKIAPGYLKNTKATYYVKVRVWADDEESNASSWSDMKTFYCKEYPSISIADMEIGKINKITASSHEFYINYRAGAQEEPLSSYQYMVYNASHVKIDQSEVFYSQEKRFICNSFQDKTGYYVRVTGTSKNGFALDTGLIGIFVEYLSTAVYSNLKAQNREQVGDIVLSTTIISIDGQYFDKYGNSGKESYVALDDGTMAVNLTDGGKAIFENGYNGTKNMSLPKDPYESTGDYCGMFRFKPLAKNIGVIMELRESRASEVWYKVYFNTSVLDGVEKSYCFMLSTDGRYMLMSNYLTDFVPDWLILYIKRVNGIYTLELEKDGDGV